MSFHSSTAGIIDVACDIVHIFEDVSLHEFSVNHYIDWIELDTPKLFLIVGFGQTAPGNDRTNTLIQRHDVTNDTLARLVVVVEA